MIDAQAELLAALAEILADNFPSDTPIEHAARLATHAASALDDAKKLANGLTSRIDLAALLNARKAARMDEIASALAARQAGDKARKSHRINPAY